MGKADHCWTASAVSLTLISSFALIKSIGVFGFSELPVERALSPLPTLPGALLTEYTGTCQVLISSLGCTFHSPPPTLLFYFFKFSKTQKRLRTKYSLLHPETHTPPRELKHLVEIGYKLIQCRSEENNLKFLVGYFYLFFFPQFFLFCFLVWGFFLVFFFFMLGKSGPSSVYSMRCREFSLICAEVQWQTLTTWIR